MLIFLLLCINRFRLAIERRREQEEVNKLIAESEEERKVQEARTVRIRQVVSKFTFL